jgi:hypothetical protein
MCVSAQIVRVTCQDLLEAEMFQTKVAQRKLRAFDAQYVFSPSLAVYEFRQERISVLLLNSSTASTDTVSK